MKFMYFSLPYWSCGTGTRAASWLAHFWFLMDSSQFLLFQEMETLIHGKTKKQTKTKLCTISQPKILHTISSRSSFLCWNNREQSIFHREWRITLWMNDLRKICRKTLYIFLIILGGRIWTCVFIHGYSNYMLVNVWLCTVSTVT